jgi:hypothetical protein
VANPCSPLLMLDGRTPSKVSKVEEVGGKAATRASLGHLYKPPEQGSLRVATPANNEQVTCLNKMKHQLRHQLVP